MRCLLPPAEKLKLPEPRFDKIVEAMECIWQVTIS